MHQRIGSRELPCFKVFFVAMKMKFFVRSFAITHEYQQIFFKKIVIKIEFENNFIVKLISKYNKMWYT